MENTIQSIYTLDLDYLVHRMVNKHKWDLLASQESVRKYKNFLILHYLYPQTSLVPTSEIDEIWHNHILHTKNYTRDCNQIFGCYIHHNPSSGSQREREFLSDQYLKTMRLYEEKFEESYGSDLEISEWLIT
jgi:hypothetical protein